MTALDYTITWQAHAKQNPEQTRLHCLDLRQKQWYTMVHIELDCASKLLVVTDEVHDECAVRGLLVTHEYAFA